MTQIFYDIAKFTLGLCLMSGICCGIWVAHKYASAVKQETALPAAASLPARVLWVWQRPEDLRNVNPATTGLAVLEKTIYLGTARPGIYIQVQPRIQPVTMPKGIQYIAVVRLETTASFPAIVHQPTMLAAITDELVRTSLVPKTAGLQIDFDAKRSERGFYRLLLQRVRAQMPASMPLTITALASWCSTDDWLAGLPVNEAVPMFFRMEPDRARMLDIEQKYRVSEPLCSRSVGVSTHEPWPPDTAGKRIYIFADRGWARDLPLLPSSSNTSLKVSPEFRR